MRFLFPFQHLTVSGRQTLHTVLILSFHSNWSNVSSKVSSKWRIVKVKVTFSCSNCSDCSSWVWSHPGPGGQVEVGGGGGGYSYYLQIIFLSLVVTLSPSVSFPEHFWGQDDWLINMDTRDKLHSLLTSSALQALRSWLLTNITLSSNEVVVTVTRLP